MLVFVAGFGLVVQACLYPNASLSRDTFIAVFRKPYWQMYGHMFLDEIEGEKIIFSIILIY